ncbi:26S proteasome SU B6 (nucleomorph) [Guillardia theta]|uniref:Proteasome subunit beta n=1 Tax=Guillardia theta TaxID=55529 RepID=Q98RS2_GUITH|nr:26S proteasome SU B6 [Guillardia theta]AAK39875.1 26S proteasome SU B6 [Guillardia theta]|mmetsp:Transcript_41897/g.132099  ORF Transcript_41897/g.132099 Transcript_41897/m.132099 type:complete len:240 (+) Transcript_41897:25-744(+)
MIRYWDFVIKKLNFNIKTYNLNFKSLNRNFDPYQNNGGLVLAITGNKFCVMASDTRISMGYSIPSRLNLRILKISNLCLLGSSGMISDINILHQKLRNEIFRLKYLNNTELNLNGIVYLTSSLLYSRRFFPFYTFNILTGINELGKASNYTYDAIGSFDCNHASTVGNCQSSAQCIMDYIEERKIPNDRNYKTILQVVSLIKIIFSTLCNKQVDMGDILQLFIVSKKGILVENSILRLD